MQNFFESKKGTVVVVEANSSSRSVISEVIKGLGFANVESMDSAKAALGYFEVETAQWLLISLFSNDAVNAIHLLQIFTQFPKFQQLRVSLLLSTDELCVAPKAYELGCLSHHPKDFTKDSIKQELTTLFEKLKEHSWNETIVSSIYLYDLLKKSGQKVPLLRLAEGIFQKYPKKGAALVQLTEAQFLNGMTREAKQSLGQLKLLENENWVPLSKTYLPDEEIYADLGVRKCLIIEPDSQVQLQFFDTFKKYGVSEIKMLEDGEAAHELLQEKNDFEIILMEWKIPKLAGPLLLQRLQASKNIPKCPVVVVSSLVQLSDGALLSEIGVAQVISKPFDEKSLVGTIVQVLQQEKYPSELRSIERKIVSLIHAKDLEGAKELFNSVCTNELVPLATLAYIEALFAFHAQDFEGAKALCMNAIQRGIEQGKSIALLGKIFIQLKEFNHAVKCFDKASAMSPKSIERLCELADAQLMCGDKDAAGNTVDKAKSIDSKNASVKAAEAKVEIQKGNRGKTVELLSEMGGIGSIISDLNSAAVAMIHQQHFVGGLEIYQRTIEAIPKKDIQNKLKVQYNAALAFARNSQLDEAKLILSRMDVTKAESKVKEKIISLAQKINDALDTGTTLKLTTSDRKIGAPSTLTADNAVKLKVPTDSVQVESTKHLEKSIVTGKAGERCCHLIFHSIEPIDALYLDLFKSTPNFKLRSAIERSETFGVDRLQGTK
jgi:CheY-like chemotaxis protein